MRIALCGEARSGKDTVAEMLEDFHSMSFGYYMKEAYYDRYPTRIGTPKDREHMIAFSKPIVDVYPTVWVDWVANELSMNMEMSSQRDYVITDLRQPHEEKWCRDNGFHIVRVHRPEEERRKAQLAKGENPDNQDLPYEVKADFHIYNDGSLEDLQSQVGNLLDCLNEQEMKRRRL